MNSLSLSDMAAGDTKDGTAGTFGERGRGKGQDDWDSDCALLLGNVCVWRDGKGERWICGVGKRRRRGLWGS